MNNSRKPNRTAQQLEAALERKAATSAGAAFQQNLGFIAENELFAFLGISLGTGRNRQSAGTLPPHYKVGRKKLYLISEVEAWIRRRRVQRNAA